MKLFPSLALSPSGRWRPAEKRNGVGHAEYGHILP
jgi:hypothetical protein